MGYRQTGKKGDYIEAMNGTKLYLKNPSKSSSPFRPIDYSQPKASRPGLAMANPFQKALASAIKNNLS